VEKSSPVSKSTARPNYITEVLWRT